MTPTDKTFAMMTKLPTPAAILAAVLWMSTAPAGAQTADLTAWTALGDVTATPGTATLTTAFADEALRSGTGALDYTVFEPALGLAFDALGGDTWDGSALSTSFATAADATVSLRWTLSTDAFEAGYADRAFAVIDGAAVRPLGTAAAGPVTGAFSHTFAAGSHSLAFGVVDVNDAAGVSTLTITDLAVTPVPEPATGASLLTGGLALAMVASRRR